MNRALPILLAALVGLAACGDDPSQTGNATAPGVEDNDTSREAGEAMDAIGNAAEDAADAVGPALDRAGEAARDFLNSAEDTVNDATRSAACQTARAAEDQEGIRANC
jgi:hypothetical protein